MDFWNDKNEKYRLQMIDVYNEQVKDLIKIISTFKIANATIHFDKVSPHMHIVGVPIIDNCTRGMKKQVVRSKLFTKTTLIEIQDKIISKLQTEKEKIKQELQKFKVFWHSIMSHFHKRICYDKDNNYNIVSDDLYKNGIFNDNDNEIANNIYKKVTMPDENKQSKSKKKIMISDFKSVEELSGGIKNGSIIHSFIDDYIRSYNY